MAMKLLGWLLGIALIYSVLFLTGALFFGKGTEALLWGAVILVSAPALWFILSRMEASSTRDPLL